MITRVRFLRVRFLLGKAFLNVQVFTFFVFTMLLAFFASAAQALPPGTYLQTCAKVGAQGDSMSASCRGRDGKLRAITSIGNISTCVGGIFNDDGALRCSRGGLPPAGSYTQSCEQQYLSGAGSLEAVCLRRDGRRQRTHLWSAGCVGDIHNDNGVLWCSRTAEPPPGSYSQTCEQVVVSGETLVGLCRERGGLLKRAALQNFRQCVGDIFNNDGNLGCRR